jgi:putative ABC transport system permease protein
MAGPSLETPAVLKLAFRNTFRHRARTLLTLGVIVAGVVAIIVAGGFIADVFVQLREATIHSQLGHIQIYRHGYRQHGAASPYKYLIEDPGTITGKLTGRPGVANAMGRLNFSGMLNNGRTDIAILGEGLEADKESQLGTSIALVAGRKLTDADAFGIMLGEGVARAANLGPDDRATLVVSTPDGAINSLDFDVVGVFRTFSKDYDARTVRVRLAAAQELLTVRAVNTLVVALHDTEATDDVAKSIRATLDAQLFEVRTWLELADFYGKTVALYRRQFMVLQIIVLVAVLLSVANSINVTVFERTGEFGTLMALGDRGKDVFWLIVAESVILGLVGGSVGAAAGSAVASAVSAVGIPMPPPPNSELGYTAQLRVTPDNLIWGMLTAVGATCLAAILPARRVARMRVVDALRHN